MALGNYLDNYLGEYVFQVGLALAVLTAAFAVLIVSRRRYVRSADFKRCFGALRFEFRRSIDETRTATSRKTAAVRENVLSVIKPIDSAVTDLAKRLARLEEHADAIDNFVAGPQKQALEQNEQIATRLAKLEQRLRAVTNELSLIEQTIDGAAVRDRDRNNSLDAINSRLMNTQKQVDELFPRLELGEKAGIDLGALIGLFVKQLKRVNINSAETALRVADLEGLRSKVTGLEERLTSTLVDDDHRSAGNSTNGSDDFVGDATPKTGDGVGSSETNNGGENASIVEGSAALTEDESNEPRLEGRTALRSRFTRAERPHQRIALGLAPALLSFWTSRTSSSPRA